MGDIKSPDIIDYILELTTIFADAIDIQEGSLPEFIG